MQSLGKPCFTGALVARVKRSSFCQYRHHSQSKRQACFEFCTSPCWFRNPRITQTQLYAESGDDTDSDSGVEFYFRPELIEHYSSNYPTLVSVLPAVKEQALVKHTLCMLCLQTMAVEQCSIHSEQVKSFCGQCWTAKRMQCRQLLHE